MKAALLLVLVASLALAAPAPPQIIVNNVTKECSNFNAGDECTSCEIPAGWASFGYGEAGAPEAYMYGYGAAGCPEGYRLVVADRNCTPSKSERCCSEGHSGAPGDCGNMAIDNKYRQCAFIDDELPPGWEGKPDGTEASDWQCPEGYGWTDGAGTIERPCMSAILICGIAFMLIIRRS